MFYTRRSAFLAVSRPREGSMQRERRTIARLARSLDQVLRRRIVATMLGGRSPALRL